MRDGWKKLSTEPYRVDEVCSSVRGVPQWTAPRTNDVRVEFDEPADKEWAKNVQLETRIYLCFAVDESTARELDATHDERQPSCTDDLVAAVGSLLASQHRSKSTKVIIRAHHAAIGAEHDGLMTLISQVLQQSTECTRYAVRAGQEILSF